MKVLIVSDDPFSTSAMSAMLTRSGYVTETANSGRLGVERAIASSPDVVVVEWFLGDMDGISVVRELRKRLPRSLRLVVVAPLTEEPARVYARKSGADELVTRPVVEDTLLLALEVSGSGPRSAVGISVGAGAAAAAAHAQRIQDEPFFVQFDENAAKHLAEFAHQPVQGSELSRLPRESGQVLHVGLAMLDAVSLVEAHVVLTSLRASAVRLARSVLRVSTVEDDALNDMLSEISSTLLGRAKTALRPAGFRFTISLPSVSSDVRDDFMCVKRATLTGGFGTLYATFGVRTARSLVVRASELRPNMVLAQDVRADDGEVLFGAGIRLTQANVDRIARHLPLRQLRVSMVGS